MILKLHALYFKSKFQEKFSFQFFISIRRSRADVLLLLDTYPPKSKVYSIDLIFIEFIYIF